jgi:hypothetical protein
MSIEWTFIFLKKNSHIGCGIEMDCRASCGGVESETESKGVRMVKYAEKNKQRQRERETERKK